MKSITVIHPSCQRPEKAAAVLKAIRQQADQPFQYILAIDDNDPTAQAYRNAYYGLWQANDVLAEGPTRNVVQALNLAATHAKGDIIMAISDDFALCPHWDTLIRSATVAESCWLLKTNDGQQPWIATLPIMDRELYRRLGYIYHPDYRHMFADTHLSAIGDLMGVTIYAPHIHFHHHHHTTGKTARDAVNVAADGTWAHGEAVYLRHHRENYGLKPDEIKGTIKDKKHLQWLKQKLG
jgi:glycosyltransferase involved in cell wall biosynthesis